MNKWIACNGYIPEKLLWVDSGKLGINPDGAMLWPNLNEMIQFNIQYHKFSTQYHKPEFRNLEYFDAYSWTMEMNKLVEIIFTVKPKSVIMIVNTITTDMRCIVLYKRSS